MMKNEGYIYAPKLDTSGNLTLRRTLYALENERRFKMRELDAKKKQFLHEHRSSAIRRKGFQRPIIDTRGLIQEKIERKRDEEKQSALELQSRSSDFIQELRAKPLSTLIKMKMKPSEVEESNKTETISHLEPPQLSMSNKVMSLYQRGLAGVLRRGRENKASPFVQSVNKILENLQDEANGGKRNSMNSFTKNILSKYAGIKTGDAETISEKSEDVSEIASTKLMSPDNDIGDNNAAAEKKLDADADEYLEKSKHSSKGLELWARVRKEQKSISILTSRETGDGLNMTNQNKENMSEMGQMRNRGEGRSKLSLNISRSRASPTRRVSSSPNKQMLLKSPISPSLPRSTKTNRGTSPSSGLIRSAGGNKGNETHSTLAKKNSSSSSVKHKTGHRSQESKSDSLPIVAVEDTDEQSHHTVVVVHDDNDSTEPLTPIQWDQSHRYSLFDNDDLGKEELDYLKSIDDKTNNPAQDSSPEITENEIDINHSNDQKTIEDRGKNDAMSEYQDTLTSEREELETSALSMYSETDFATSTGTGTRSQSRQGNRKSRRLSMQTTGALRALTSVLKAQSKHADRLENDTSSYSTVVNALADMASNVEEQARKLDNFRRAGPSLAGRESHVSSTGVPREGNDRLSRRLSTGSSDRGSSSFVTNDVYKFLERRSSSKTMPRRQTLSKLELKLLSQAPGEDVVGRRNSLSSLKPIGRGSVDFPSSNSPSVRGSNSGSLADVTSSLLDLDRQKTPRRHSMSTVSERLRAVSPLSPSHLSNISENESLAGGPEVGKTLRSYSWAPDVSETTDGHVLAMELLARNNRSGMSRFRTVTHMLKWLGEEYRRQTASMMYEELRYCTYLRLAPHQVPDTLKDTNFNGMF